jgi:glycerol uptake facilitator-like aquaporin
MAYDPLRRAVAEFVGTFALIFVGMGAIVFAGSSGLVGVALAHGLVIAVMASAVGHISGGHFNPAVTLGFLVTGRIAPSLAAVYWGAQLAGATVGALALRGLFPGEANLDNGVPVVNDVVSAGAAVGIEAILTFFLVWVIFATATDPGGAFKSIAGLAIGLTITFDILAAGPLTGRLAGTRLVHARRRRDGCRLGRAGHSRAPGPGVSEPGRASRRSSRRGGCGTRRPPGGDSRRTRGRS